MWTLYRSVVEKRVKAKLSIYRSISAKSFLKENRKCARVHTVSLSVMMRTTIEETFVVGAFVFTGRLRDNFNCFMTEF